MLLEKYEHNPEVSTAAENWPGVVSVLHSRVCIYACLHMVSCLRNTKTCIQNVVASGKMVETNYMTT